MSSENFSEIQALYALQRNWPKFEDILNSVVENAEFRGFLESYRGHHDNSTPEHRLTLRNIFLAELKNFYCDCLSQYSGFSIPLSESFLKDFESAVNTALYYWHGLGDRNFQFRTIVHFLGISPEPLQVSSDTTSLSMLVNEWGIGFSQEQSFFEFPRRASLARVCGITSLKLKLPLDENDKAVLFAKARLLQREFCLLIDEWEHCNSILAVKQFALRKMPQGELSLAHSKMQEISRTRDELAKWCVSTAADFQLFISRAIAIPSLDSDIKAEVKALNALVLSGLQKFLLPASVSRHVYSSDVLSEVMRWVGFRLSTEPEDMFTLISELAFSTALNKRIDAAKILHILNGKSFDWILSADPSAAVKSVCWGLTRFEHRLLTVLLIIVIDSKVTPHYLDSHWIHTIASVVEMPGTFSVPEKTDSTLQCDLEQFGLFNSRAIAAIEKSLANSRDDALKTSQFIKEFLLSEINPQGEGGAPHREPLK